MLIKNYFQNLQISLWDIKILKRRFSKLLKEFEILQKENISLREENKYLKEEKASSSSKHNTSKVNVQLLQEKSLAKFVNGIKNLKKIMKDRGNYNGKLGIGYDRGKDLKKNKSTSECSKYRKSRHKQILSKEDIKKPLSWYLDSGYLQPMTRERPMFQDL
ncbi:hypothetical protein CR513_45886, partial [Mucuna pruriens]